MDHQASTSDDHRESEIFTNVVLQETPQKNTILHVAAKLKQVENARRIIAEDSSLLHQTNSKKDTPLHVAARIGCLEMAQLLIELANEDQDVEADEKLLRMVNVGKDTALHDAVRNGHFQIVKFLIENDSHLALLENDAGESALFLAVDRQYFDIASHILQKAPSCSFRGRNGLNVMHAAIIRTTKAKDYYHNNHGTMYTSPLIKFVVCMIYPSFRRSKISKLGCTKIDFIEEVKKKCPSTILEADELGWIPLHYAALVGHVKAVELFLKDNNSLAYKKGSKGMFAIHIAAREGHVDIMKELIGTCSEASELLDDNDQTALHVAAKSGKAGVVKYILKTPDFDGLINQQDKEGNTPLMLAGVNGHYRVAVLLATDSRIDNAVVNRKGVSAIDIILANTLFDNFQKARLARELKCSGVLAIACMKEVINTENTKTKKLTYKKAEPENNEEHAAQDRKAKKLKDMTKFDIVAVNDYRKCHLCSRFRYDCKGKQEK